MQYINEHEAAIHLKEGEVVALPTETVYGLAANALDPVAARKIFDIKGRPLIDPLIVHVHSLEQAQELAFFNQQASLCAQALWPGPLTLILPKKPIVSDIITANQGTVALRLPNNAIFRQVLELAQCPLAAPSANPFSYISPTRTSHVEESLGDKIPYIVDGGPCTFGIESTILDLSGREPKILRPGPITAQMIEEKTGIRTNVLNVNEKHPIQSPGSLSKHYSPSTPLVLFECEKEVPKTERSAIVYFQKPSHVNYVSGQDVYWLTHNGSLKEAAKELFSMLRKLDKKAYKTIFFQSPPTEGIGIALNDRLYRAASKIGGFIRSEQV